MKKFLAMILSIMLLALPCASLADADAAASSAYAESADSARNSSTPAGNNATAAAAGAERLLLLRTAMPHKMGAAAEKTRRSLSL